MSGVGVRGRGLRSWRVVGVLAAGLAAAAVTAVAATGSVKAIPSAGCFVQTTYAGCGFEVTGDPKAPPWGVTV